MLKLCVLASGSKGNCVYIESGNSKILIDAGVSRKQILLRLDEIGVSIDEIQGVFITHAHTDHICGLRVLSQYHGTKIYVNAKTKKVIENKYDDYSEVRWVTFKNDKVVKIGNLQIKAISKVHDCADPVCFLVSDDNKNVGVITDLGSFDDNLVSEFKKCSCLVMEFNHDLVKLRKSDYPYHLQERIASNVGHLNNDQASRFLKGFKNSILDTVFVAHVSENANTSKLALNAAKSTFSGNDVDIFATYPDRISKIWG